MLTYARPSDPTMVVIERFRDPSQWGTVKYGVPVFAPHRRSAKVNGRQVEIDVTSDDLQDLADKAQRLESEDGVPLRLTLGHINQELPEADPRQPPLVGYARNVQVGTYGPKGKPCLTADIYIFRERYEQARDFPFRSVDYLPSVDEVRGVALLKRDPFLNLGVVTYGAQPGERRQSANRPATAEGASRAALQVQQYGGNFDAVLYEIKRETDLTSDDPPVMPWPAGAQPDNHGQDPHHTEHRLANLLTDYRGRGGEVSNKLHGRIMQIHSEGGCKGDWHQCLRRAVQEICPEHLGALTPEESPSMSQATSGIPVPPGSVPVKYQYRSIVDGQMHETIVHVPAHRRRATHIEASQAVRYCSEHPSVKYEDALAAAKSDLLTDDGAGLNIPDGLLRALEPPSAKEARSQWDKAGAGTYDFRHDDGSLSVTLIRECLAVKASQPSLSWDAVVKAAKDRIAKRGADGIGQDYRLINTGIK
jgi:hypothetical protein